MTYAAHQKQERALLARRLAIAVATPIVLLVLLGVVLSRQVFGMAEDAHWVDHSDEVIATANDTLKQVIDQETGLRGYLTTRNRLFLEPFNRAHPEGGFARLEQIVADNPLQVQRVVDAHLRYQGWLKTVQPFVDGHELERGSSLDTMLETKMRMDGVRDKMREIIDIEQTLRRTRVLESTASVSTTKTALVVLLGASAIVLAFLSRRQMSSIAATFGEALESETKARAATEDEAWIRTAQNELVEALQGELTLEQLGAACLGVLAARCGAEVGAFFTEEAGTWKRRAGFGLDSRTAGAASFATGEGLVGRAAKAGELLHLRDVPPDFLMVRSGTGETTPVEVVVLPALIEGITLGVVELGCLHPIDARALALLGRVGEAVGLAVRSTHYKQQLRELLEESQRQAEELQTQQEELRVANEELEAQTSALRATQLQLETQKAEIEQTNDSLTEQAQLLEHQNTRLAETQAEIAAKAREVERASQFKSEFLSNMSHELRTPLNSSLIMAKLLADNRDGNLTTEQVKFAETIYGAGNDLLTLINDILDLSKIEAGKMEVNASSVPLERVRATLQRTFEGLAKQKGIRFDVVFGPTAPSAIETDGQRLEQILKNLGSNALKFTEKGEVVVEVSSQGGRVLFAVRDTGIGIPPAQQAIIFEAFRQADGTTNRKYGGTGLGLSISRELAHLLGGTISVTSEAGKGSVFTVSLPLVFTAPAPAERAAAARGSVHPGPLPPRPASEPPPSRLAAVPSEAPAIHGGIALEPGRRILLIIEDDEPFAQIMAGAARDASFQCLLASTAEQGIHLAKKHIPAAIVLDMGLPDHSGLSVLDRLKHDPVTRHIPVHVISASDFTQTALSMGATAYLMKPVQREQLITAFRALEERSSRSMRRVLVVDDDERLRESVAKLLGRSDVEIRTAGTVSEALALLRESTFDCVVTDLGMPDQSGYDLLETMATQAPYSVPPVIVYTGRALTPDEEQRLRRYSKSIIVKGARSPERLLDEVTLFLHQVESELPADQQRLLKQARHRETVFEGRVILVVEDDVRNIFALTSVLEPKGARVAIARNGKEALAALEKEPRVDLVLMDIMMPEMDGLEATRHIRKNPKWNRLPIIALTAKAMRDDQERCIAAGANDYLAKPLDVEVLLSLLRVWMPKT